MTCPIPPKETGDINAWIEYWPKFVEWVNMWCDENKQ